KEGDADPTPGSIEIDNVTAGDYALSVTPPDGYSAVEPPVTVHVGTSEPTQVTLAFRAAATPQVGTPVSTGEATPAQAATGVVVVLGYEEDGTTPVGGFCIGLTGPATFTVCDDKEGDADLTPGSIELDAVPVADYALAVTPPDGYEVVEAPTS